MKTHRSPMRGQGNCVPSRASRPSAARYQIPIGTLRDWEQGRSEPDQPAKP
jgi:hypothetical protein